MRRDTMEPYRQQVAALDRTRVAGMQIPFSAFAEDCTIAGEIELPGARLSDFLASTAELQVEHATFRALDDGRVVEVDSVAVLRDDLCIVWATGPRGRAERRFWTRQQPVRARVGQYFVFGYLHAPPTVDPLRSSHRRTIVALTNSIVDYAEGGANMHVEAEAVLVNCSRIESLEVATDQELRLARHLELGTPVDPRARDLTGNP